MHEPPYYRDYSSARLLVHSVVTSKYFDLAIAAVIGLNVVTMALEFYMMPKVSLTSMNINTISHTSKSYNIVIEFFSDYIIYAFTFLSVLKWC